MTIHGVRIAFDWRFSRLEISEVAIQEDVVLSAIAGFPELQTLHLSPFVTAYPLPLTNRQALPSGSFPSLVSVTASLPSLHYLLGHVSAPTPKLRSIIIPHLAHGDATSPRLTIPVENVFELFLLAYFYCPSVTHIDLILDEVQYLNAPGSFADLFEPLLACSSILSFKVAVVGSTAHILNPSNDDWMRVSESLPMLETLAYSTGEHYDEASHTAGPGQVPRATFESIGELLKAAPGLRRIAIPLVVATNAALPLNHCLLQSMDVSTWEIQDFDMQKTVDYLESMTGALSAFGWKVAANAESDQQKLYGALIESREEWLSIWRAPFCPPHFPRDVAVTMSI